MYSGVFGVSVSLIWTLSTLLLLCASPESVSGSYSPVGKEYDYHEGTYRPSTYDYSYYDNSVNEVEDRSYQNSKGSYQNSKDETELEELLYQAIASTLQNTVQPSTYSQHSNPMSSAARILTYGNQAKSGYYPQQMSYSQQRKQSYGQKQEMKGYGQQMMGYQQQQPSGYGYSMRKKKHSSYEDEHEDEDEGYGHKMMTYKPRRKKKKQKVKKVYVPIVIRKKKKKKRKTISVFKGFYIQGGTQIFGKFKKMKDCQKACEITPNCFAADYNPWLKKCYVHTNVSACEEMRTHPKLIHFKKVPCDLLETPRGLITLGVRIFGGLEQKGIKNLQDCIKKCATAGQGIAPDSMPINLAKQICFGIDYDFATHKCYFHTDETLCPAIDPIPTPVQVVEAPSVINILLCPLTSVTA